MLRELSCDLTEDEVMARGQALAQMERDLGLLEYARKSEARASREAIKEKREEIDKTAGEIREKRARRDVEVREEKLLDARIMRTVRLDTMEVIDSRALTEDELQVDIDDVLARPRISNEDLHEFETKLGEHAEQQRVKDVATKPLKLDGDEKPKRKGRGKGKKKATVETEAAE